MRNFCLKRLVPFELRAECLVEEISVTHFPFHVGRLKVCDLPLEHDQVSRHHCVFFLKEGQVFVEDKGSLNGTRLNGEPFAGPRPIHDGDVITIACLTFEVHVLADVEAAEIAETGREFHRVLVVEDNEDAAETLAVLIEDMGHQVHVAHDGQEAIRVARAQHPDVVFLDIRLPGMNGYQLAGYLRRHAGLQSSRMVAITGYHDEDHCREVGIDRLLIKPVDPATLQEVLSV